MISKGLRVCKMFSASELHTNSRAHHCLVSEVYMRIVVELPKPFRTVVVDANADVMNEFAGLGVSGFEKAIEGNAVVAIELMTPDYMSVLLLRVKTHIENCVCRDTIVAAELMCNSQLHRVARIPKEIEESPEIRPRHTGNSNSLTGAKL